METPNGKASGTDNLPSKIYKIYRDILLPELLKVLNQGFDSFKLPESMNDASIIVIPKPDKDPTLPES